MFDALAPSSSSESSESDDSDQGGQQPRKQTRIPIRVSSAPPGAAPQQLSRRRRAIHAALNRAELDLDGLRALALAPGGLVDNDTRARAWPRLLGVSRVDAAARDFRRDVVPHADTDQIARDVERASFSFRAVRRMTEATRARSLRALSAVINAVVCRNPGLHYYQGFHDVATVFLLVAEEDVAFQLTERAALLYFRECMRPNFSVVGAALTEVLPQLLRAADPAVAAFVEESGVSAFVALPWVITCFAHDLRDFSTVARLFDALLASPPVFPLYLAAAHIASRRDALLAGECEFSAVHCCLQGVPPDLDAERLIAAARALMEALPPEALAVPPLGTLMRPLSRGERVVGDLALLEGGGRGGRGGRGGAKGKRRRTRASRARRRKLREAAAASPSPPSPPPSPSASASAKVPRLAWVTAAAAAAAAAVAWAAAAAEMEGGWG